jgi:DNA-binding transcriptional LysR family regulator
LICSAGICRTAGFEPAIRSQSFHTGWELRILADMPVVALTPESVARQLPSGVAAIPISDAADRLETCMVWRTDHIVPAAAALRKVAGTLFGLDGALGGAGRRP